MEADPVPTDPAELRSLIDQALPMLGTKEGYSQLTLSMMALNQVLGWRMEFKQDPNGKWMFVSESGDTAPVESRNKQVRKLIAGNWNELTVQQQENVLAGMEQIGREMAQELRTRGNESPAEMHHFLRAFGSLVRRDPDLLALALLTMDPRTTTFCLALETERRRLFGELPLEENVRILEFRRAAMALRMASAERALSEEYWRVFGSPCPIDFEFLASVAIECPPDPDTFPEDEVGLARDYLNSETYLAVVAALSENPALRDAAIAVGRARSEYVLVCWSLNKASGWDLWREGSTRIHIDKPTFPIKSLLS
jgi:hypothetical protein